VAPPARPPAPLEALVGARALADAALWSAGLRAALPLDGRWALAAELDLAGGGARAGEARASLLLGTAALSARLAVLSAAVDVEVGAGVRGGLAHLAGAATARWAPRAGTGPFAGPTATLSLRTRRRPGAQVGVDLEAGHALVASAGTAPDAREIDPAGPWLALRCTVGVWR
jgi:hypothetical protein